PEAATRPRVESDQITTAPQPRQKVPPSATVKRKLRLARSIPLSSAPTVEAMNCQKNNEPCCAVEMEHRAATRGSIGPRRVVTTPSTMNSAQAKSVKAAALRGLNPGAWRLAGAGSVVAEDILVCELE